MERESWSYDYFSSLRITGIGWEDGGIGVPTDCLGQAEWEGVCIGVNVDFLRHRRWNGFDMI